MAVVFQAAVTLGSVAANPPTFNLTLPTFASGNLAVNDIIIIAVMSKNIVEASNEINTPTDFTEKGTKTEVDSATAADDMRTALFYKRAVAGDDGATVAISRAGTDTLGLYAVATIWRGATTTGDPFDTVGIKTGGSATAGDVIVFPAIDPVATDVHVIYDGWKADDSTDPLANFANDSTTFVVHDDQETTTGTDTTHGTWSANRNGDPLNAVSVSVVGTDGSYIGYAFALLPGLEAISASAALTVVPAVAGAETETIASTATLTVAPSVVAASTETIVSTGALTVVPTVAGAATETIAGTAALAVTPQLWIPDIGAEEFPNATETFAGTAALSVVLAVAGACTVVNPVVASAALTIAPSVAAASTETIASASALTVAPSVVGAGTETIAGTGALTLVPAVVGSSGETISSSAVLTIAPAVVGAGAETVASTAVLTISPSVVATSTETIASAGALVVDPAVAGVGVPEGPAGISGSAALVIAPSVSGASTEAITASGALAIEPQVAGSAEMALPPEVVKGINLRHWERGVLPPGLGNRVEW